MPRKAHAFARRELLLPLVVALVLRVALVAAVPVMPTWDGVIYDRAGEQLARGDGYTQRIMDGSAERKATAFFPVGLPAVLALLRLLGGGPGAVVAMQAVAGTLLVPVAWLLGRRAGGRRAGKIAAWLVALWPGGVLLSASYLAEPLSALGLGLAMLPVAYARRRRLPVACALAALVLGVTAYLRATPLAVAPFALGLAGLAYARGATSRPRRLAHAAVFAVAGLVVAAVPLAPWAVRNARALGTPALVSTNGGFNLLLGTTGEGGYGDSVAAIDCPPGLLERDQDTCRRDRALARIGRDPVAWLARGALKLSHTLGYESAPAQYWGFAISAPHEGAAYERETTVALAACRVFWVVLLALSALGLARACKDAWRRPTAAHAALLGPLAGFALLHFVYIGGDRYHAVVVPMLAALAGLVVSARRRT